MKQLEREKRMQSSGKKKFLRIQHNEENVDTDIHDIDGKRN